MQPVRPVRIDPVPGEALDSWVGRIADANLVRLSERPRPDHDARKLPTRQNVTAAGAWSGAPHLAADMTLYAYPWGVRGRADRARVRSWRVQGATWSCPLCTTATGVRLRDWSLACHPLCLVCGSILVDGRADPDGTLRRADAATLDVQRRIARALERVRVEGRTRPLWRATYRLSTLIALTADVDWPQLPAWESDVRADLSALYRGWHRCPPTDPSQATWVVFEAWRGTESPARGQRLIAEGWDRLLRLPDPEVRQIGDTRGVLPDRPRRLALPPRDASAADTTLTTMVRAVRRLQMSTGLDERHIPAWCVMNDDLAPDERDWTDRAHLAVVLHALCTGAARRRWTGERQAVADLRLWGIEPNTVMRLLRDGRGLALEHAHDVARSAEYLVKHGLVDYRERRGALWPMVHRGTVSGRPSSVDGIPEQRLADWIWVHATRGPVPRSTTRTRAAVALNEVLDPETRLRLLTVALADADDATVDVALETSMPRGVGELA